MDGKIRITTTPDQLTEGLFGQIIVWTLEILPYLDHRGIFPAWAIRSKRYGTPDDYLVIPGLLEINYDAGAENHQDINLKNLRDDHVVTLGNDWDYNAKLWNKYFRWPARVIRRADQFPSLKTALGIHYRGTDKNTDTQQTNPVSQEDFLRLVRDFVETHPDIDTIFAASDEDSFVAKIQAEHKNLKVLDSGKVTFWKDSAPEDGFGKGDHALLDCLLLSRCKYLLKCQSALSGFAKVLNPRLEAYRVSANKLAPYFFGIPYFPDAFLPKLTSQNPECQKILAGLLAGDWTEDRGAMKKYGVPFNYKNRKRYSRRGGSISKWSWDGIQMRLDRRLARLAR